MSLPFSTLRRIAGLLAFCLASLAHAQDLVRSTVEQYLRAQTKGLPGEVTYQVGTLDPRLQIGPCSAMEPFLPGGGKLWGNTTVGLRCLGPSSWTIYVPVQINVIGTYYVAARGLAPGTQLREADLVRHRGDLTALPGGVITDPAQAVGKTLRHGLGAGQPVRGDQLQAPHVVQQGQSVKLVAKGSGFAVSSEGKALNHAADGQVVQVRTPGGQVVSGIARPGGTVEVNF